MRNQTALSSFLVSEKMPDAGKHSKKRAEKEDQMILKGSNGAVGRIDTRHHLGSTVSAVRAHEAGARILFSRHAGSWKREGCG